MHVVRQLGVAVLAVVILLLVGCQSSGRTASSSTASTPQDKARQEQLSNMSRQDAEDVEDADAPAGHSGTRPPLDANRRTGQRIVDQPVTPRR